MDEKLLAGLGTEAVGERTAHIDEMETAEALYAINDLDAEIAPAVRRAIPDVARLVDAAHERMRAGGRIIYMARAPRGDWAFWTRVSAPQHTACRMGCSWGLSPAARRR